MDRQITIGDKYRPAMTITEQAAADAYFAECVAHTMGFGKPQAQAEDIERQNLGYFAGYYDHVTRERVERLFQCRHPIFGSIAEQGPPTMEEAFALGMAAGQKAKVADAGSPTPKG